MTTRMRAQLAGLAVATVVGGALVPLSMSPASAATLPSAPVILGPTDSSTQLKSVTLTWQPVPGASSYKVEVGTDEDWADDPTYAATSVVPQLTLPTWLPHAAYVWRVAAVKDSVQGRWSAPSPLGTFARGWRNQVTGLTVSEDVNGVPTWSWNPIASASGYEIQFSNSPMFNDPSPGQTQATPVAESCYTHHPRFTAYTDQKSHNLSNLGGCKLDLFVNGTPSYWRVRGLDLLDAPAQDVDTTPAIDEGISHLPPGAEADSVDFSDCPVVNASPSPSASPAPSPSGSASPSASPSVSPSASPSPAAGSPCTPTQPVEKGAWSSIASYVPARQTRYYGDFRSLPVVQTQPLTADPANGCTGTTEVVCTEFPTLHWSPSVVNGTQATRYRIYISLDDSYSNIQRVVETSALQWTPSESWRDSTATQSYYYVVQPCTPDGCGAVTGTPPSFKKRSPAVVPVGHRLANGASVLSWNDYADTLSNVATDRNGGVRVAAGSEAAAYHVQVSTPDNPDFQTAGLVDEATVDGAIDSSNVVSYASSAKAYGDGTFLWRVQAVDASGHKLPWSPVGTFVRDATAPTAVAAPAQQVSAKPLVKVTFSEPVTGVSSSTLSLQGVPGHVVVVDDTHATVSPVSPLVPGAKYALTLAPGIKDLSGNSAVSPSTVVTVNPLADDRSPAVSYAGAWRALASTNAVSGGFHATTPVSRYPTAAAVTTSGTGVLVTGCVGPSNGVFRVYVDGVLKASRDTYRTYSGCGVRLVRVSGLTATGHRVQIRATGVRNAQSKGTTVGLDAVTALP